MRVSAEIFCHPHDHVYLLACLLACSHTVLDTHRSSGKMPEGVRNAVKFACITHGDMDADQAERFLSAMESRRRWQEECWS